MKKSILPCFAVLLITIAGCGKSDKVEPVIRQQPPPPVSLPLSTEDISERVALLVKKSEAILAGETCTVSDARPECKIVSLKSPDVLPARDVTKQGLMIIDQDIIVPSVMVHRDKVVARYIEDEETGNYIPEVIDLKVPAGFADLMSMFRESPSLASHKAFEFTALETIRKFRTWVSELANTHFLRHDSSTTLNLLAELSPNAQIVTVNSTFGGEKYDPVCSIDLNSVEGASREAAYWRKKGEKILEIAKKHSIGFINASFGWDDKVSFGIIRTSCNREASQAETSAYTLATLEFFRVLSEAGLFVSQSAAQPGIAITAENKELFASDCADIPGRLRVGFANAGRLDHIPFEGGYFEDALSITQKNGYLCMDVLYNTGQVNEPVYSTPTGREIKYSLFGLGAGPKTIMGTSWISPVGLAHAMAVSVQNSNLSAAEIVAQIKGNSPKPRILDAFEHRLHQNPWPWYINSRIK